MILDMKQALGEWHPLLKNLFTIPEGIRLGQRVAQDIDRLQPDLSKVFRALQLTPPERVKVIIIGQDPYPGGHADGLAFSTGIDHIPYSLQNIFLSMAEYGIIRTRGDLSDWARQGVLLLNTVLTTIRGQVKAHDDIGWKLITGQVLGLLSILQDSTIHKDPLVVIAWGTEAKNMVTVAAFKYRIRTLVLEGNHPGAIKHGYIFRGGEHFIKANEFLEQHGAKPILWGD